MIKKLSFSQKFKIFILLFFLLIVVLFIHTLGFFYYTIDNTAHCLLNREIALGVVRSAKKYDNSINKLIFEKSSNGEKINYIASQRISELWITNPPIGYDQQLANMVKSSNPDYVRALGYFGNCTLGKAGDDFFIFTIQEYLEGDKKPTVASVVISIRGLRTKISRGRNNYDYEKINSLLNKITYNTKNPKILSVLNEHR